MITNTKWKYIPEKEREALMRLTMCAREECSMCKFQDDCSFDFQRELATKNMNILADALRKTEPITHDDYIESENDYLEARCLNCNNAKACKEKHWDGCVYEPKYEGNNSEIQNNCDYAENPSGDVWECGCFLDTYCEHQIYDWNHDGTINIVECGYEPKDEPTCSKMEQVEDEPQTNADQHVQRVEYVGNDERSRCWKCKHFERMHETPISSDGKYYTYVVCTAKECNYEPKDELQIEYIETEDEKLREQCRAFMGIVEQTERSN